MLSFFQRPFPSANAVLLHGSRPVLVDPGFGADVPALEEWLRAQNVPAARLSLIVNTHHDCDHAGANGTLAAQHGTPIAAHRAEGEPINRREEGACRAHYLDQPVEPYRVTRLLEDGDMVHTGTTGWTVVHTPGHTPGHISLFARQHGILVTGDVVHADDLGWLDPTKPESIDMHEASLQRLLRLDVGCAYSGHGGVTSFPTQAIEAALTRVARWRADPARMAWHAAKRIFAYALMLHDGLPEAAIGPYLRDAPWAVAFAATLGLDAPGFQDALLSEMRRASAARWEGDRLLPTATFVPPRRNWMRGPTRVAHWPKLAA